MMDQFLVPALIIIGFAAFYAFGLKIGRGQERERVESLLVGAIRKNGSKSVGWVWNAVAEGKDTLMSYEKFFGPKNIKELSVKIVGYEQTRDIDKELDHSTGNITSMKPVEGSERAWIEMGLPDHSFVKIEISSKILDKIISAWPK
jgi:hypothetical protein